MGSSERGHGAGTARAAIAIQVEGSKRMGTALKGEHDGTWGLALGEERLPVPGCKRSLGSPDIHPPRPGSHSPPHTPLAPPRLGLRSSPGDRVFLASHLRLGGDASPGRRVKRDPTDWARGPPLAGRGARHRGGCHASRALGNLGLQATPSGGSGSSRALGPLPGAACAGGARLSPPAAAARPAPTAPRAHPRYARPHLALPLGPGTPSPLCASLRGPQPPSFAFFLRN